MGKDNGIIRDGAKGGNWARVVNGALQVRVVAGGGTSISFPITPAQGGTGTSTVFTQGSVVFVGPAGVYAQDNANFFWDNTTKFLGVGTNSPQAPIHAITSTGSIIIAERNGGTAATTGLLSFFMSQFGFPGGTGADGIFRSDWGFGVQVNAASSVLTAFKCNLSGDMEITRALIVNTDALIVNSSKRTLLGTTTDDGTNRLQVAGGITGTAFNFTCGSGVNGPTQINYTTSANGGSVLLINGSGSTTGTTYVVSCSVSSTVNAIFYVQQNGNGNSTFNATVAGTGDAVFQVATNGVTTWSFGLDNSDSDRFKLSASSSLGTSDVFAVTTTGRMLIGTSTDDGNTQVQIKAPSDYQLSLDAPSGDRFTSLTLLNNGSLVGQLFHDHTNSYNALSYGSTRMITWDADGAVVGINQGAHEAGFLLAVTGTTGAFGPPRMTSTQRDALNSSTPVKGMLIYNTTTDKFQGYNGAWVDFH